MAACQKRESKQRVDQGCIEVLHSGTHRKTPLCTLPKDNSWESIQFHKISDAVALSLQCCEVSYGHDDGHFDYAGNADFTLGNEGDIWVGVGPGALYKVTLIPVAWQ